ncbi:MAG TPA: sugar transferase, partial [Gemmatimonadales bacterium]|nr:sugar transferase [Gemmatimonadales bacterium]
MLPPARPQRSHRNERNLPSGDRHLRLVVPAGSAELTLRGLWRERLERISNISIAVIALVVTLPLWLLIAILIKLTSRGPVFYHQIRIGLDSRSTDQQSSDPRRSKDLGGRPFRIYKFRTMTVDAEGKSGAVWASRNDPRVTVVGRILRQLRLDELPQFINVIRGEMNIVGPRPEQPTLFAELRD